MPACFDPPECVVITDQSSVAASGIANVSPIFRAITLAADDRLCGSLGSVNSERRFYLLTETEHPILRRRAYALSPAFCCLDFPPRQRRGESSSSQSASYSIQNLHGFFHLSVVFRWRIVEVMLAKILSGAVVGLDAISVIVEVDIAERGLPSFTIVGLPDKAVEESKERVRAALRNSGAEFPARRITVNLAPADIPKVGPAYDLPIALGILIASEQLKDVKGGVYIGELSLDGSLRHTNGILPVGLLAKMTKGPHEFFVPAIDAKEASIIQGLSVYPIATLRELVLHLSGEKLVAPLPVEPFASFVEDVTYEYDMVDIHGQELAKRALEIAAAGGHNIFMQGPPGAGKTLLARTLPSILPDFSEEEAIEVTKVYSVTGNIPIGKSLITTRPFRAPHHTTSRIGLIGGGTRPVPGEITLAHRGVLFLDEFPEFPRHVLEALRQPLEDGIVSISRAAGTVRFPSIFMFVGAANPCPCGNLGSSIKRCTCLAGTIMRYQKRLSGPIMDRIDIHIQVPAVDPKKFHDNSKNGETSADIKARVEAARHIQRLRYKGTKYFSNAELSTRACREYCRLSTDALTLLQQAVSRLSLSARGYYRVMKLGRTIADLEKSKDVSVSHIGEALQYRFAD